MAIKSEVTFSDFTDAFHRANRYDQFGYQALRVLFDHLEEMSEDTGQDYELDVIALCCEYSADTFAEVAEQYKIDIEGLDDDEIEETVTEYLQNETMVAGTTKDGQIIYVQF